MASYDVWVRHMVSQWCKYFICTENISSTAKNHMDSTKHLGFPFSLFIWWLILYVKLVSPDWHCFWVCLWWCFEMGLAFGAVDSVKESVLLSAGGYHSVHWGLNRTNSGGRRNFTSFVFWPHWLTDWTGASHPIFLCPWTKVYVISSPNFQTFGLGLNYTTSFLRSLAPEVRSWKMLYA